VNPQINELMVRRAVDLLDCGPGDRIADFFCGLGNFTLAIARQAGSVIGYEGSPTLVKRAQNNADLHGLSSCASFHEANLFAVTQEWLTTQDRWDRVLLDPPREGALALCQAFAGLHQSQRVESLPHRLVYVSCNPATLARDAAILVHEGGWRLSQAGVINMFPQTAHVESIARFDRAA